MTKYCMASLSNVYVSVLAICLLQLIKNVTVYNGRKPCNLHWHPSNKIWSYHSLWEWTMHATCLWVVAHHNLHIPLSNFSCWHDGNTASVSLKNRETEAITLESDVCWKIIGDSTGSGGGTGLPISILFLILGENCSIIGGRVSCVRTSV